MGEAGPEIVVPDIKFAGPVTLPPDQEKQFQSDIKDTPWYTEFKQKYGEEPNLDDPDYNYRRAWLVGVRPDTRNQNDGMYHWSDTTTAGEILKSPHHPTAWMEPFMRQYPGVDPETSNDPRVGAFKQAWQSKYSVRETEK